MMIVKRHYSQQERQYLLSAINQVKTEKKVSDEKACIEVGVPLSTFYGWRSKQKKKLSRIEVESKPIVTPFPSFLFSNSYQPRTEVILVGAS